MKKEAYKLYWFNFIKKLIIFAPISERKRVCLKRIILFEARAPLGKSTLLHPPKLKKDKKRKLQIIAHPNAQYGSARLLN